MQVVFQITSGEHGAQLSMLGQLDNLLTYAGGQQTRIAVEVVVHGKAWNLLLADENPLSERIGLLHSRSVSFIICRNTLNSQGLQPGQLLPFVKIVPAAIAHLIERQQAGWAYIRC